MRRRASQRSAQIAREERHQKISRRMPRGRIIVASHPRHQRVEESKSPGASAPALALRRAANDYLTRFSRHPNLTIGGVRWAEQSGRGVRIGTGFLLIPWLGEKWRGGG